MALNKKVKGEGEVLNDSFLAGSGKAKIVFFKTTFRLNGSQEFMTIYIFEYF
nr:hypothetical protein [Oenococcus oeni]